MNQVITHITASNVQKLSNAQVLVILEKVSAQICYLKRIVSISPTWSQQQAEADADIDYLETILPILNSELERRNNS